MDQRTTDLRSSNILNDTFRDLKSLIEREFSTKQKVNTNANSLKITNVSQFKSYSVRMLKALREDLAKIQNEYVNLINTNIDQYLKFKESVEHMSPESLREIIE